MAYVTEANECCQKFLLEVFDRTLSSHDRHIFHDLNPKAPGHWYYKDLLEHHHNAQQANPNYGYNYGHFTVADNLSISDQRLAQLLTTYDRNSVWYKRDILGLRIAAEGLVYPLFANDPQRFILKTPKSIQYGVVGVDFGGTKSAHSFTLTGFTAGLQDVIILREWYHKNTNGALNPEKLTAAFLQFVRDALSVCRVTAAYCDSAEQTLIAGLRTAAARERLPVTVLNAAKLPICDRIAFYCTIMAQNRFYISPDCPALIDALSTAVFDPKNPVEDVRLDNGSTNIDSLDSMEYTTEALHKAILFGGMNR